MSKGYMYSIDDTFYNIEFNPNEFHTLMTLSNIVPVEFEPSLCLYLYFDLENPIATWSYGTLPDYTRMEDVDCITLIIAKHKSDKTNKVRYLCSVSEFMLNFPYYYSIPELMNHIIAFKSFLILSGGTEISHEAIEQMVCRIQS